MKYILILFPLFLFSGNGIAQKSFTDKFKYLAVYQFTYQPDSTDVTSKKTEEMLLYLGDKSSRFSSAGQTAKEELIGNRTRGDRSAADFSKLQSRMPETSLHYAIIKHYPTSKMSYTESVATDRFRYTQDMNLLTWEIKEERKEISGYKVQKATTDFAGRHYKAWFTPEIPIPDGPYKFGGLPGLILEIRDTKEHYVFQLLSFMELESTKEVHFDSKDFISTNRENFLQVKKRYDKDPIAAVERAGVKFGFEPGLRERLQKDHLEQLRKLNNPIELE